MVSPVNGSVQTLFLIWMFLKLQRMLNNHEWYSRWQFLKQNMYLECISISAILLQREYNLQCGCFSFLDNTFLHSIRKNQNSSLRWLHGMWIMMNYIYYWNVNCCGPVRDRCHLTSIWCRIASHPRATRASLSSSGTSSRGRTVCNKEHFVIPIMLYTWENQESS